MANLIGLNTAQIPTLTQFVVSGTTGHFDFLAQKSGATVNMAADPVLKAVVKSYSQGGFPLVVES